MELHQIFHIAVFTFSQALASTLLALAIGLPAAFFCGRRSFPGRKLLKSLAVIPFCVPSLLIALGYVTFLGMNGDLNKTLMLLFKLKEPPVKLLYSFAGLVIAQGFYNFPLIMKNVSDTWENLPSEQADNARLLGATERRIFRTVTIFQLLPSITSACLIVFIYCFLSFILVLLFGGLGNSTLEVEIYKAAKSSLDFKTAAFLGIAETFILCIVVIFHAFAEKKSDEKTKGLNSFGQLRPKIGGNIEKISFIILLLIILVFFICPLLGIVKNAFTSSASKTVLKRQDLNLQLSFMNFEKILKMKRFWPSVKNTIITGIFTGAFCTFLGFLYSVFMRLTEKNTTWAVKIILKTLPMLPMCISSVTAGLLIMLIFPRGNLFCLILAQTSLFWPLAFRTIYPQLSKISDETLDSAKMLSKGKIDSIVRIIFPLSKKSLLSAFGFSFAISAGDTTLPLVLSIPDFSTLSLFTYRLAGAYRFNEACASGLILGLLCIAGFNIRGKRK